MAPSPKDITTTDSTWNSSSLTRTTNWYKRLQGPNYLVRKATIRITAIKGQEEPERLINMGGIQFKRVTRRGRHHFYRAI